MTAISTGAASPSVIEQWSKLSESGSIHYIAGASSSARCGR